MAPEFYWPAASVGIALLALVFTTFLLSRQVHQMEHERNALALLEAINRLTSAALVDVFDRLGTADSRYATDEEFAANYPGSQDEHDVQMAGAYVETIACLARRGVLDASLIVDAAGLTLRRRWHSIRHFVERRRRVMGNPYILHNFEWLAMYSVWWKERPYPKHANYNPQQFAGLEFQI